jgi:hypothetical protein
MKDSENQKRKYLWTSPASSTGLKEGRQVLEGTEEAEYRRKEEREGPGDSHPEVCLDFFPKT